MKKILFLLITSMIVMSCGISGEEPKGPNNDSDIVLPDEYYDNEKDDKPTTVVPTPESSKYAKVSFKNNSSINMYAVYVNGILECSVKPKTTSSVYRYYPNTYQIVVKQSENIYNENVATYSKNYNLDAGDTQTISFPNLGSMILKSNSPDDYNISINDGMWEYVCLAGNTITLSNIDCTTYKVKLTQRNGYMFYPTVETYYVTVNKTGTTLKFNP